MRLRAEQALFLALLVLCLVADPAGASSPAGHLDRGFGRAGIAAAVVPKGDREIKGFAVGADGRVYVLDGSLLLAFRSDGEVARGFGEDGRVDVVPADDIGQARPEGLAIDSQGRVVVVGSIQGPVRQYWPSYTAYVIRILPDGSRDPGLGDDGEVDTDLRPPTAAVGSEPPSVYATSILVDARDRLLIAGSYGETTEPCEVNDGRGPTPFVARLTAAGDTDKTFGSGGVALLREKGSVIALARNPAGGLAVFSRPCNGPPRPETLPPRLTDLSKSGHAGASAVGARLPFTWVAPAIDPKGRIVELESPPPAAVEYAPEGLVRRLPNGKPDSDFGRHGRVVLHEPRYVSAFAVDAAGRPIVAAAGRRIELRRFRTNGAVDQRFGPEGRLEAVVGAPSAIAFDAEGRVYTVTLAGSQSRTTVEVARFIPGP